MEISIKDIKKEDMDALLDIVCSTWGFKESFSQKLSLKVGRLYIAACLCRSDFLKAALKDGRAVGMIAARTPKFRYGDLKKGLYFLKSLADVLLHPKAWRALKLFSDIKALNAEMYKNSGGNFDGEIVLFAIDKSFRGSGIGKRLFFEAISFLKQQGADNYAVFTDTKCNYGFYEHYGACKLKEKEFAAPL